jgi:hypothetical protein
MDLTRTDWSGVMAGTRNEDWYARYLRGEIGDKEARRLERAELRRWIRWIETDPQAPRERRAWWRTFAARLEEFPLSPARFQEARLWLARSLRRCVLPMPLTWEALRRDPERDRYLVYVYSMVDVRWAHEAGVLSFTRGRIVPVIAENLDKWWRAWPKQDWVPVEELVWVLWWEKPPYAAPTVPEGR